MKYLKGIVIFLVILIIAIIIILGVLNMKKEDPRVNEQGIVGNEGEVIDYDTVEVKQVDDNTKFYTVRNCISQYLDVININNSRYYDAQNQKIVTDEELNTEVYNLLDKEYIEKNNITKDNVFDYVDKVEEKLSCTPLEMNYIESPTIERYGIHAMLQDINNNYIKDIYLIVNLDFKNKTFSIEPLGDNYKDLSEVTLVKKEGNIEENDQNSYIEQKINNEYISNQYFSLYRRNILTNPEFVYEHMSSDYSEKRFGTIDDFKKYVSDNLSDIQTIQFKQYLVNTYGEYIEYVAKDQYGNLYIFKEKNPMDFELELDDYTLRNEDEEYKQEYESLSDRNKVANNANIWIKMLNNRDYKSAFEVLDETFRTTYFQNNVDVFEQIMREKYPGHYEIEFTDYSEETGIPIITFMMTDISGKTSIQIEQNIYMQLKEGTDFVMSFNVK